jgi:hypothetical protein
MEIGMTERKPREITFASWVDQQISDAAERGAFDNLPGAGKPISRRGGTDAWLQDYLRREGVSADELLPTPLRLRKEVERLTETVQDLRSEDEVREVVKVLNRRIVEWRRIPDGPPVYLRLVEATRAAGPGPARRPGPGLANAPLALVAPPLGLTLRCPRRCPSTVRSDDQAAGDRPVGERHAGRGQAGRDASPAQARRLA